MKGGRLYLLYSDCSLHVSRRVNQLDAADDAQLMQQALVLIVNAADEKDAEVIAREISNLRASGELARLVSSMGIVDF